MHIAGKNRLQIEMSCLEDRITAENSVRVIDAFIDAFDLKKLGFGSSIPEYSTFESLIATTRTPSFKQIEQRNKEYPHIVTLLNQ